MPDIRTRQVNKGTIKSLDKVATSADRMRATYTKTKERTESMRESDDNSPASYATERISNAMDTGSRESISVSEKATRVLVSNAKVKIKERRISNGYSATAEASVKTAEETATIKTRGFANKRQMTRRISNAKATNATRQYANDMLVLTAEERMRKAAKEVAKETKNAVRVSAKAIKVAIASTESLVKAITAGGWITIIAIVVCCLFGAAFYMFGDESSGNYTPVSAQVEAYSAVIGEYADKYGIGEYAELIKAVMMQESGGKGKDPMQASESGYNKKYPRKPGSIRDPEYSISCGVQKVVASLKASKCKSPLDMSRIRLALQGYNFGNDYISWAIKRDGGYTVENALIFSDQQAKKHGWTFYGDKQYPAHVLRYYPYGSYNYGVGNGVITKVATQQLGNKGGHKFWSWYGFNGRVEWCACFVSWCANQCGYIKSGTITKFAAVQSGISWFKSKGQWQRPGYRPKSGDIIFFDWDGDNNADHVGIVKSCNGRTITTIEGNSGDICRRRTYTVGGAVIYGYGVPKY
ncbi:lysozyme family protein [Aminicella lysinilytica]|uniref:CHAP domain-containing protein n=1 Tax=Aminicella lysinilytica TaxID=433323 RepID=A0A4R6Q0C6_9FIRM|nr:lysozyme family protein [Aminicella lysinilytica]TDP46457.1 CHAP domain-containing protein [Aminicella lysinilytica]